LIQSGRLDLTKRPTNLEGKEGSEMTQSNSLAAAAHHYLPRTVPLRPRGKEPALLDWPNRFLCGSEVDDYWRKYPDANVGIRCGDGLVVIDVDPRNGGTETLASLPPMPDTREVVTGRGGRHLYYHHAGEDLPSFNLGPGVEVKGRRGRQVVAPPSIHPNGRLYVWHPSRPPDAATLPAWILQAAEQHGAPSARAEREPAAYRDDFVRSVEARDYIPILADREVNRQGFATCPFHKGGNERTPSLHARGRLWCCYSDDCPPRPGAGRERLGGDIYTLAALLMEFSTPLEGSDFLIVEEVVFDRLEAYHGVAA
jgi:Bifunctional DNA primase/polymerase, N-terminal